MLKFENGMYVKGFVKISSKALDALANDKVFPDRVRGENYYDSFVIPHGSPCLEFLEHIGGNPACPGKLLVKGE